VSARGQDEVGEHLRDRAPRDRGERGVRLGVLRDERRLVQRVPPVRERGQLCGEKRATSTSSTSTSPA
jgi:hypothetical protein